MADAAPSIEVALRQAILALRSFQFGNQAEEFAGRIADVGDSALIAAGLRPETPIGRAISRVTDELTAPYRQRRRG